MAQSEQFLELTKKRSRGRRWLRIVVLLLFIAAAAGGVTWAKKFRGRGQEGSRVRTAPVTRGTIERTIDCTGVVAAATGAQVKIGSQISGRIRRLYADLDTQVKAGQIIAEIDVPDLRANLEAAERNLEQARARYRQQLQGVGMQHTQLVSAFEQASEDVRRAQAAKEQAASAVSAAQSRLASAQAAVEGAKARLRQAEAKVRSARVATQSQSTQTLTDVQKAQAALETAKANLTQVQKTADLEVATSEAALKQAESNAQLALADLKRLEALLEKGFVSGQAVDAQRNKAEVAQQQVASQKAALEMTKEKVAADLAAARSQVDQAQAALTAAQAGSLQETIRAEDVRSAEEDVENAKAAVTQAELSVEAASAELRSAQSQAKSAESDLKRAQAAQRTALANLTQDKIKQQEVKAAYEAMRQAQAQVAYQRAQFEKSFIRSPISGTVVSLTQQEGETVAAQLAAPTLIEVVDLARLQVDAYVDETDIGQVKTGLRATVTVDAFPDREFTGRVTKIASVATIKENVVTYQVTIGLDKYPVGMLKPQMTADVRIKLGEHRNVLLVPTEAIKQRREGTQVVVLRDGKAEVRSIRTGIADEDSTEILEGLRENEVVVLAGFEQLGVQGFSSAAEVPRFLRRTPFGGPPSAPTKGRGGGK